MKISLRPASVVAPLLFCLSVALAASGRPGGADDIRTPGAARATSARATTILGSAWTADNSPIKQARVRLRNVISGRIEATATANDAGQFSFESVEGGSYLVELVSASNKVQVAGHVFTIAPGETVATFVRLGTRVPWFTNFFGNTVSAVSSTAASEGITAIAPVARPVSANQ